MVSYLVASMVVFLLGSACMVRLRMQSRISADYRRLTCISFMAISLGVVLFAISPDFAHPRIPSDSVLALPTRALVQPESIKSKVAPSSVTPAFVPLNQADVTAPTHPNVTDVGIAVIFGGAVLAAWWVLSLVATVRLYVRSRPAESQLQRLTRYRIRVSDDVRAPLSLGSPFCTVLLPPEARRLEPEQIELIVRHEEAHIVRRDHLWNTIGYALCAIQWFNPMAWAMLSRFRLEAEMVADDAVLAGGCLASRYAELLVHFENAARTPIPTLPALTFVGKSDLADRLRAVLSTSNQRIPMNHRQKIRSSFGAVLTGVVVCVLVGARPAQQQLKQSGATGASENSRNIELVQVGMQDDSGHVTAWDPAGNILPASEVIDHPWRPKEVDKDGVVSRYRHVIFRVEAKPDDIKPETCVGSVKANSPGDPGIGTGYASSDYMYTKNGWHYFDDHLSQEPWGLHLTRFDAKGKVTKSIVETPKVKDLGIGRLKPTNVGVQFTTGHLADVGSLPDEIAKETFKLSVGKNFPPLFHQDWKNWTEVRFDLDCSGPISHEFRVITTDGRTVPEDDVLGSFNQGTNDIKKVHMMYIVNRPMDQIKDVRVLGQPTFRTDLLNVPLSPKQVATP